MTNHFRVLIMALIIGNCKAHPNVEHLEWVNLSIVQYHLCYATHGSRNNTFVKSKALLIGGKKINIKLRKESFYATYIYSFCHDVAFEGMEYTL